MPALNGETKTLLFKRLRVETWLVLAAYFSLAYGWTGDTAEFALRLAFLFFFLLAFRVFDDLACAAYEIKKGDIRFYHEARVAQRYAFFGMGFSFLFFILAPLARLSLPGIGIFSASCGILYVIFQRGPLVKWISILKYPFLVLILPTPELPRAWIAAAIFALFALREAVEEKLVPGALKPVPYGAAVLLPLFILWFKT